jgi:protein-export membrane protein SecD
VRRKAKGILVVIGASLFLFGAVAVVAVWWLLHPSPVLRLVYRVELQEAVQHRLGGPASEERRAALERDIMEQTLRVVRRRAAPLGRGVEVLSHGDQIQVQVPRLSDGDLEALKRRLLLRARLEFRLVDDGAEWPRRITRRVPPPVGVRVKRGNYQGAAEEVQYVTLTAGSLETLEGYLDAVAEAEAPPEQREVRFGEGWGPHGRQTVFELYLLHRRALLTGAHVARAEVMVDPAVGRPEVSLTFTAEGARLFEEVTRRNVGRRLAILLDSRVTSAPVIVSSIRGGRARISLGGYKDLATLEIGARDLAAVLEAGALPAELVLLRSEALGR